MNMEHLKIPIIEFAHCILDTNLLSPLGPKSDSGKVCQFTKGCFRTVERATAAMTLLYTEPVRAAGIMVQNVIETKAGSNLEPNGDMRISTVNEGVARSILEVLKVWTAKGINLGRRRS